MGRGKVLSDIRVEILLAVDALEVLLLNEDIDAFLDHRDLNENVSER